MFWNFNFSHLSQKWRFLWPLHVKAIVFSSHGNDLLRLMHLVFKSDTWTYYFTDAEDVL